MGTALENSKTPARRSRSSVPKELRSPPGVHGSRTPGTALGSLIAPPPGSAPAACQTWTALASSLLRGPASRSQPSVRRRQSDGIADRRPDQRLDIDAVAGDESLPPHARRDDRGDSDPRHPCHPARRSALVVDVDEVKARLAGLAKGETKRSETVGSEAELQSLYDELTASGKPVPTSGVDEGVRMMELRDGTRISIRPSSKLVDQPLRCGILAARDQQRCISMTVLERCVRELLVSGSVDWVSSSEVAGIAAENGRATSTEQNRSLSLQMITEVVRRRLMEIGQLDAAQRGFRRWDMSPEDSLAAVARAWPAEGPRPGTSDVCWLRNTAEGDRQAELLSTREP
ncbi:MAG: hypothetical protein HMLKMBBP_03657 [Planctomycetes bacterium]|nr:hypothetical protein [Planctomycetota bacterium]